jgi:hypothetical protein
VAAGAPEYAWRTTGEEAHYCLGRYGRLFDQIGPIVAADAATAVALASAALQHVGQKSAMVDAYDENETFVAWLRSAGFDAHRPLYRMRRGPRRHAPSLAPREFAILGPEFG